MKYTYPEGDEEREGSVGGGGAERVVQAAGDHVEAWSDGAHEVLGERRAEV